MANASFTRDEVILALDVLYHSDGKPFTKSSLAIAELCELLQELPIYPQEERPPIFRNESGVSHQLSQLRLSSEKGFKDPNVGIIFYNVLHEFEADMSSLHEIAQAIRRNKDYYSRYSFGRIEETDGMPEGALLSHLHRVIEVRDGAGLSKEKRCAICKIAPNEIYQGSDLLEMHLLVPITELDAGRKYKASEFATVCPTCHAALHRLRPWRTRETIEDILR